jgi:predicted nucleic acid-binding protein
MKIDRNTLLFFDTSCLIAAAGSLTGGSGFLLTMCARGYLSAAISQPVLLEAQRNIQVKLGDKAVKSFYTLLTLVPFSLASLPDTDQLEKLEKLVNKKDVHVIAAALNVRAPFLIALDIGLILEVKKTNLEIIALTPGEFIKTILPRHIDYPEVKE